MKNHSHNDHGIHYSHQADWRSQEISHKLGIDRDMQDLSPFKRSLDPTSMRTFVPETEFSCRDITFIRICLGSPCLHTFPHMAGTFQSFLPMSQSEATMPARTNGSDKHHNNKKTHTFCYVTALVGIQINIPDWQVYSSNENLATVDTWRLFISELACLSPENTNTKKIDLQIDNPALFYFFKRNCH